MASPLSSVLQTLASRRVSLGNTSRCFQSTKAQIITYFSDPFDSTCNPNTFPSKPQLSGTAYFDEPGSTPYGSQLFFVDPHLHTPYTYQYNLSIQHELAPNLIFEASYLGSSSHGLTSLQDINPFKLGTTDRILNLSRRETVHVPTQTPGTPAGWVAASGPWMSLRTLSLQCQLQCLDREPDKERWKYPCQQRLFYGLPCTYGHSIDNASGFQQRNDGIVPSYQPELLLGPRAISTVRNRITFSGGWDLPFDRAWHSGPRRLTQGWSLFRRY